MRFNIIRQALLSSTQSSLALPPQSKRVILSLIFASVTSIASATDYSASAVINANTSHNDNLRLVQSDKTAVTKYQVAPVLTLDASTETSKLALTSTFSFNRYDKNEFNSDDQNIALALAHQFENSSVGLNAAIVRESTITSELLTSGNISDKAEPTEIYRISPNWTYILNETNQLQLSATYSTQDYHSAGYTGYKNTGAEVDWIYIFNERTKWVTAVNYSDFDSDDVTFGVPNQDVSGDYGTVPANRFGQQSYSTRTKNEGVQVGIDHQWSEESLLQARVGSSQNSTSYPLSSTQDFCANPYYIALQAAQYPVGGICNLPDQNDRLFTAELDWTWHNERQQFGLNTTQSSQPTSSGYTVDQLQIGSNWSYALTELDQISTSLTLVRNRAIGGSNSIQNSSSADRNYGNASLNYRHQISEQWFLNAGYTFSKQKYTQIDNQANSNVVSLGISYQPQQWHWSR